MQAHIYPCYDEAVESRGSCGSSGSKAPGYVWWACCCRHDGPRMLPLPQRALSAGAATASSSGLVYKLNAAPAPVLPSSRLVSRRHCCKGCQGPVLRAIQVRTARAARAVPFSGCCVQLASRCPAHPVAQSAHATSLACLPTLLPMPACPLQRFGRPAPRQTKASAAAQGGDSSSGGSSSAPGAAAAGLEAGTPQRRQPAKKVGWLPLRAVLVCFRACLPSPLYFGTGTLLQLPFSSQPSCCCLRRTLASCTSAWTRPVPMWAPPPSAWWPASTTGRAPACWAPPCRRPSGEGAQD